MREFWDKLWRTPPAPTLDVVRDTHGKAAIVLIHGFSAIAESAFGTLPEILIEDTQFDNWDVYRLQYRSELRLNLHFVSAEPNIELLGAYLATTIATEPLNGYDVLFLVGHSMGGLVVQSALLHAESLRRVRYVLLLGTPSNGIRWLPPILTQLRDLRFGSNYIRSLRDRWGETFGSGTPFRLAAVAGNNDPVVDADSSLSAFPETQRAVISGDHSTIASVDSPRHPLLGIMHRLIQNDALVSGPVDTALLALEEKHYDEVIAALRQRENLLDGVGLVTLALAHDALGDTAEAIRLLSSRADLHLDALGVLGGRHKRLWLTGQAREDFDRSMTFYSQGLSGARLAADPKQILYHSINLAFLTVMNTPEATEEPPQAREFALEASRATELVPERDYWSVATLAEAQLILREYSRAIETYTETQAYAAQIRERQSTYLNARHVALRRRRPDLDGRISRAIFGR